MVTLSVRAPGQHRPRGLCRTEGWGAGADLGLELCGLEVSVAVPRPLLRTGSSGSMGLGSGVDTTPTSAFSAARAARRSVPCGCCGGAPGILCFGGAASSAPAAMSDSGLAPRGFLLGSPEWARLLRKLGESWLWFFTLWWVVQIIYIIVLRD